MNPDSTPPTPESTTPVIPEPVSDSPQTTSLSADTNPAPVSGESTQPVANTPTPMQNATPLQMLEDFEHKEEASFVQALHRHEKLSSIICASVVAIVTFTNCFAIMHILKVREKKRNELPSVKLEKAQNTFGDEVVDRPDGKLDVSKTLEPTTTTREQHLQAKLRQQINFSTGLSVMVTDFQRDWHPEDKRADKPRAGYEYLRLHVVMGSRATKGELFLFPSNVNYVLDGKTKETVAYSSLGYYKDVASGQKLLNETGSPKVKSGETLEGELIIEVPKGTKPDVAFVFDDVPALAASENGDVKSSIVTIDAKVALQ